MMSFFAAIQPYLVLILPLLLINFLTHFVYFYRAGGAYLQQISPPRTGKMTYLIAGNLNQPLTAFRFLADEIMGEGVTAVNYLPSGFKPERIAGQIIKDIDENYYHAVVYTISVGDQVGHYIRRVCDNKVPVIAINPCTTPIFLKKPIYYVMKIFTPILMIIDWALGWLSEIKWIPASGNRYSLTLLFTQWFQIAYGPHVSFRKDQTIPLGIICSRRDEFLDNDNIDMVYPQATTEYIDSTHGNTINDGKKYLAGIRALERYAGGDFWKYSKLLYIRDREYAEH